MRQGHAGNTEEARQEADCDRPREREQQRDVVERKERLSNLSGELSDMISGLLLLLLLLRVPVVLIYPQNDAGENE